MERKKSAPKKQVASPAKEKQKKPEKGEEGVKKPPNAFFRFGMDWAAKEKERNPDKKHKELMKEAGEKWQAMTAKEKEPFEKAYEKEKAKYDKLPASKKKLP